MRLLKGIIDFTTLGSNRPIRRLLAYYTVLVLFTVVLVYVFPVLNQQLFSGERLDELTSSPQLLRDGLGSDQFQTPVITLPDRVQLAIITMSMMVGVILLMLPVSWVYMSARRTRGFSQSIVQTLIILPIVVAGIVLIVRNSLALAFSLAGIVAGVRFRNTLRDARDAVFIFLAIAVGLSAGVQALTVSFLLSMTFNFVVLFIWRYEFGQNVLEPAPGSQWAEPLMELASKNGSAVVPDRDLALALSPKKVSLLAERFERVQSIVGERGKKPRYNAVLWITTHNLADAQPRVETILDQEVKRWKLDEVISNESKPSELYYLVRLRKSTTREDLLTVVRARAGDRIQGAELDTGEALLPEPENN